MGVHNSGYRTAVRSQTETSRAARRDGGTTKLVPWTTSTGPSTSPPAGVDPGPDPQQGGGGHRGPGRAHPGRQAATAAGPSPVAVKP